MELRDLEQSNQEKNVPAPPPLEIDIRTMETDLKSFQETGGEVSGVGISSEYSSLDQMANKSVSGYRGAEKSIFTPSSDILSRQAQSSQTSNLKLIFMILGILAVAVGLGLLGYYVIFPIIFK